MDQWTSQMLILSIQTLDQNHPYKCNKDRFPLTKPHTQHTSSHVFSIAAFLLTVQTRSPLVKKLEQDMRQQWYVFKRNGSSKPLLLSDKYQDYKTVA